MSWIKTLYDTYEYLDKESEKSNFKVDDLLPPAFINQNAQLHVILDEDGDFQSANLIDKNEAVTATPVSEKSASRTNKPAPHALFDNLMYVAGDLSKYYLDEKKVNIYDEFFTPYIKNLEEWVESKYSNEYVKLIFSYLKRETLTKELIDSGVLITNDNNMLDSTKTHQNTLQHKYFVRFSVDIDGEVIDLWKNKEFRKTYSLFYLDKIKVERESRLCHATGMRMPVTDLHGKYIRFPGDAAKLISANDSVNFTYRGRFSTSREASEVGYEVSEKAHSALRYLISKQGFRRNGLTILAWSNGHEVPQIEESTKNLLGKNVDNITEDRLYKIDVDSNQAFAKELSNGILGKNASLENAQANIIVLDAATPGRMSMQYFREMNAEEYRQKIINWHEQLCWPTKFRNENKEIVKYIGAPSLYDICLYAFGSEKAGKMSIDEHYKFVNQKMSRLLPCILDGAPLPLDYLRGAYMNAINPLSKEYYNWDKSVDIACSLIKKHYFDRRRELIDMSLNREFRDRSYLFGRLLAVADRIESHSNYKDGNDRKPNARRLMEVYSQRPYKTWKIIETGLTPYLRKLDKIGDLYIKNIDEIMALFDEKNFASNRPLEPMFLLGYHHQRHQFEKDIKEAKQIKE